MEENVIQCFIRQMAAGAALVFIWIDRLVSFGSDTMHGSLELVTQLPNIMSSMGD